MKRDERHQPMPSPKRETLADVLRDLRRALKAAAATDGTGGMDSVEAGDFLRRWRGCE